MKAKTLSSKEVWKSSDGQRTIWEIEIKADDGKEYRLKTYSEKLGTIGFEGEVESYMNPRGERFIRQPKQEGGYQGGKNKQNNQPVIQAQWAIGQARGFIRDRGEILPEEDYWKEVERTAKKLIETVNSILGGSESTNPKVKKTTNPALLKPGEPIWPSDEAVDDEALSLYMAVTLAEQEAN